MNIVAYDLEPFERGFLERSCLTKEAILYIDNPMSIENVEDCYCTDLVVVSHSCSLDFDMMRLLAELGVHHVVVSAAHTRESRLFTTEFASLQWTEIAFSHQHVACQQRLAQLLSAIETNHCRCPYCLQHQQRNPNS